MNTKTPPAETPVDETALRASFDYALNGILDAAADGRITACNPAAASILGQSPRRLRGATLESLLVHDDATAERWRRHLATIEEQGVNLVTLTLAAAQGPRHLEIASVDIGDGRRLHILDDITEQRTLTQSLEAARRAADEASAAKSAFLTNMSHEIRTPLNAIVGIERLLQLTPLTPQQGAYLDDLRRASQSLLALLGNVLDLSKIEAGRLDLETRPFEVRELIDTVLATCRPAAAQKALRLAVEIDPALPPRLLGDPLRLAQVANNLLANAIKFTATGQVSFAVAWTPAAQEQGQLRLVVSDTGIGMSEAELGRVFAPFVQADASTTRRFGGTGLGLAIARGVIECMGGHITASSREGAGSRFVVEVTLPRAPDAAPSPAEAIARTDLEGLRDEFVGTRALVVEDDAVNRRVIEGLLRFVGLAVDCAEDGRIACERLLAAGAQAPDLVLMDLQMPGMDGICATRALREAGFRAPIVALTADVTAGTREACLAAGMNDWLGKPPDLEDLEAVLTRWLPARRGPPARPDGPRDSPGQAPAAGELPGIDLEDALERFIGNRALFEQSLRSFVHNRAPEIERIAALVARGEHAPLERLLHNLAGSSGMLGARAVYAAVRELEKALARPSGAGLAEGAVRLQAAFAELAEGVNRHLP